MVFDMRSKNNILKTLRRLTIADALSASSIGERLSAIIFSNSLYIRYLFFPIDLLHRFQIAKLTVFFK
jgi:hypothetical protein